MEYIWKVKDKEYKLKLRTRTIPAIESKIGSSLFEIMGTDGNSFPKFNSIVAVIHAAIQYDSLMTEEVVCDIIDEWLEDGHQYADLLDLMLEIFYSSGIFERPEEEDKAKDKKKPAKK